MNANAQQQLQRQFNPEEFIALNKKAIFSYGKTKAFFSSSPIDDEDILSIAYVSAYEAANEDDFWQKFKEEIKKTLDTSTKITNESINDEIFKCRQINFHQVIINCPSTPEKVLLLEEEKELKEYEENKCNSASYKVSRLKEFTSTLLILDYLLKKIGKKTRMYWILTIEAELLGIKKQKDVVNYINFKIGKKVTRQTIRDCLKGSMVQMDKIINRISERANNLRRLSSETTDELLPCEVLATIKNGTDPIPLIIENITKKCKSIYEYIKENPDAANFLKRKCLMAKGLKIAIELAKKTRS